MLIHFHLIFVSQGALRRHIAKRVAEERRDELRELRRLEEMGRASIVVQALARRYIARGECLGDLPGLQGRLDATELAQEMLLCVSLTFQLTES